jgi:putative intracellular protease/amidase
MAARIAWLIVFDGFADWQTALACREICRKDGFDLRVAGLSLEPVTSASGLVVQPQSTIADVSPAGSCLLMLPGGPLWEERDVPEATAFTLAFREAGVPIAAICTGTLVPARAGLLSGVRHTSNGLAWLKSSVPEYDGEGRYVNVLDVSENGMITAHAAGYVDYAHEIIKVLELLDEPERRAWYRLHREGVLPPGS